MGPPGKNGPQGLKVSRTVKSIFKVSLHERIIDSVFYPQGKEGTRGFSGLRGMPGAQVSF